MRSQGQFLYNPENCKFYRRRYENGSHTPVNLVPCDDDEVADLPNSAPHGRWFLAPMINGDFAPEKTWSTRATGACLSFPYLILESDEVSRKKAARILASLPAGILSIVDSGNASLHGSVPVFANTKDQFDAIADSWKPILSAVGFDPAAMGATQLSRIAGAQRLEYNGFQTLLHLAPDPAPLTIDSTSPFESMHQVAEFVLEFVESLNLAAEIPILESKLAEKNKADKTPNQSNQGEASHARSKPTRTSLPKRPKQSSSGSSPAMEARQTNGGKAHRSVRRELRGQLHAAGDMLVLSPEAHVALTAKIVEKFGLDPKDAAGIVDKVCADPHRPMGTGIGRRPYKDMEDEEFQGPLNFHYPASFWHTDYERLSLQQTEECYTEFAWTAWVLHRRCGINRNDMFQWLQGFYESRKPLNPHIAVPGHIKVSDRVRKVTNKTLPADQAEKLLTRWRWHYGCESDMDELLSTMEKHLGEAGLDLWDWIEEDLCRLEAKYWHREQPQCGNRRLTSIAIAVRAIFADQLETKQKKMPQITTEMIFDWLADHPEHDFNVKSAKDDQKSQTKEPDPKTEALKAREAKLTSILRGLRMLVEADCLIEIPNQGKSKRKAAVFEPGKAPLPVSGHPGTTKGNPSRYRHTMACGDTIDNTSNPGPRRKPGIRTGTETATPSNDRLLPLPDSASQIPAGNTSTLITSTPPKGGAELNVSQKEDTQVTGTIKRRQYRTSSITSSEPAITESRTEARRRHRVCEQKDAEKKARLIAKAAKETARAAKAAEKAARKQARAEEKAARMAKKEQAKLARSSKPKKPKSLGVPGVTFRLQSVPSDGAIVVGRLDSGSNAQEPVGLFSRKRVNPMLRFEGLDVPVVVESIESALGDRLEITGLLPLTGDVETRLLAETILKPKNPVVGPFGRHYLRVRFSLPVWRCPRGFTSPSDVELRRASPCDVKILWLRRRLAEPDGVEPFWVLEAHRIESQNDPALAKMASERAVSVRVATIRRAMLIKRRLNPSNLGG
jgi:hypothetical protein